VRGEGVQSFSRAFLAAGARSTITTLWRVADEPTADFMRVFYYHLQRGESKAGALRETKLTFLRNGGALADPHFWAAFILTGNGDRPIPRAVAWRTVWMIGAVFLMVAFLAVRFRRRT
jgi:CHAT domain-containing protein